MKRGKKYIEAAKLIERGNLYDKEEAVALVKKAATAKFDETIEAHIRTPVWVTFAVFGMMGYLLYAFCFGMLGALVSKTEDISKASMPVTMIYLVSFFIAIYGMNDSDGILMRVASFVPFTSNNGMLIRVTMGSVETWEIIISGIILAASCVIAGVLAAKIFRFGTLMYGNPIKFSTALKKIREK